jgi:hypothetical protein
MVPHDNYPSYSRGRGWEKVENSRPGWEKGSKILSQKENTK